MKSLLLRAVPLCDTLIYQHKQKAVQRNTTSQAFPLPLPIVGVCKLTNTSTETRGLLVSPQVQPNQENSKSCASDLIITQPPRTKVDTSSNDTVSRDFNEEKRDLMRNRHKLKKGGGAGPNDGHDCCTLKNPPGLFSTPCTAWQSIAMAKFSASSFIIISLPTLGTPAMLNRTDRWFLSLFSKPKLHIPSNLKSATVCRTVFIARQFTTSHCLCDVFGAGQSGHCSLKTQRCL